MKAIIEAYRQRAGQTQVKVRFQPGSVANTNWGKWVAGCAEKINQLSEISDDQEVASGVDPVVDPNAAPDESIALRQQLEDEQKRHTEIEEKAAVTIKALEQQVAGYKAKEKEQAELAQLSGVKPPVAAKPAKPQDKPVAQEK